MDCMRSSSLSSRCRFTLHVARHTQGRPASRTKRGNPAKDPPRKMFHHVHWGPLLLYSTLPVTACMFCSENIPTSDRLTSKRRKLICNVETIEFKDSVLKCARERCDEWGNLVAKRIESAAAEAKYHRHCAQEFFQCRGENTVGKPADAAREHAFSELCIS